MSKLAITVMFDITVSDELNASAPYARLYNVGSEIETIISDGCDAEGFSYERIAADIETHVLDDGRIEYIYEIEENP